MMLLLFFIISLALSGATLLSRNRIVTKTIALAFAAMLIAVTAHAIINIGKTELTYFTYESTSVLLLAVLALLTMPTV